MRSPWGAVALALLAASACGGDRPPRVRSWPVMGTYATVTVRADGDAASDRAVGIVRARFAAVDASMSNWSESSALSRLNRAASERPARIEDGDLAACVAAALDGARRTDGAFDPTVGPLMRAWGFRPRSPRVPTEAALAEARARVGFSRVRYDAAARTIAFGVAGMELDLGGIAKGCALDRAARELEAIGPALRGALLNLGGNLAAAGADPAPWTIGIRDPLDADAPPLATLPLAPRAAIASSSDEENHFEAGGVRYGHVMDPRTGRPASTDVVQATAIAPTATETEIVGKALFVAGSRGAAAVLARFPRAEAVLIVREPGGLAMLASASLRGRLETTAEGRRRLGGAGPRFALPAATMPGPVTP